MEPTRRYRTTNRAADCGRFRTETLTAVMVQSLDLDEVLSLSDRVGVMLRGKIVAVLTFPTEAVIEC